MPQIITILLFLFPLAIFPAVAMYSETMPRASLLLGVSGILLFKLDGWRQSTLTQTTAGRLFLAVVGCEAVWLILASIFGVDPGLAIFGTGWRRFGLFSQLAILVLMLSVANRIAAAPEWVAVLFRSVSAGGIFVALYGTSQYLGWDPLLHANLVEFAGKFRPPGTFGNPTYFANYLLFPILTGLGLGLGEGRALWKRTGWISASVGFLALLLTGTRSAVASLMVGVLVLVWRLRPRISRLHWTGVGIFAVLMCGFVVSPAGSRLRDRLGQWVQDPVGGPRMLIYRDTLRMARDHPLLGTGPDSFEIVFPRYQSPELARAYPDFYEESPHNVCLDYLTSQGVPGVLCFLALSGLGIVASGNKQTLPSAVVLACLAAAFVAHQLTTFVLPTALLYFVFVGAAVGLAAEPARPEAAVPVATKSWLELCLFPIAALFMVIALQWFYVEFKWRAIKSEVDTRNFGAAVQNYDVLETIRPAEPGLDLWFSQQLAAWTSSRRGAGPPAEVVAAVSRAATRACGTSADRQNAYYNLGLVALQGNDASAAEQAFRSASEQAPNWYKPHLVLAEILLQTGRADAAESEALKAIDLSGGRHPETLQTLAAIRGRRASSVH